MNAQQTMRHIVSAFNDLDDIIWHKGGRYYRGRYTHREEKGTPKWYLARLDEYTMALFDLVDTYMIFEGRWIRGPGGRYDSRSEAKIARALHDMGIRFRPHPQLRLGDTTLTLDFYLSDEGVYIEYWGRADFDPEYKQKMGAKLVTYRRHNIPVLSLYPRQMDDIPKAIRDGLKKTKGDETKPVESGKSG